MTTPYAPFLIGNQRTGVDLGIDPWLTPADAYLEITDAYQFRGVVTKRDGYSWFTSMPYAIEGSGGHEYQNIASITNTINALVTTYGNHGLVVGQLIQITDATGSAASQVNGIRWSVQSVPSTTTFTLNNTTAFAPDTIDNDSGTLSALPYAVGINPGNPIMAIAYYLDSSNLSHMIVLDTRRAAIYDAIQGALKPIGYLDQFSGNQKNLFWWENYRSVIYFTNNVDTIFYWNDTQQAVGLTIFTPNISVASTSYIVNKCLMIKAANGRLCLYNTNETDSSGTNNFFTRIRWCQANVSPITGGSPPTPPDLGSTYWFQDTPGKGGKNFDITDSLYIISQGQIQTNNLLISQNQQFASIYEQRPTSDPVNAYVFVRIAVSRSVDSTFGTIVLDREIQMMGNTGLIMSEGNSFGRFDEKIPDFTIDVMSQNNFQTAFGIRNDPQWQTWTAFCSTESDQVNDQVLVYNYQDRSFQIFRISMACFGLIPDPAPDPTWLSFGNQTWEDFNQETWESLPQKNSTLLLGGDYSGNVWQMNQGGADAAYNIAYNNVVPSGYISDGLPITMELMSRQWFPYGNLGVASQFGYVDFLIDGDPTTVVVIEFFVDNQNAPYLRRTFPCIPFEDIAFNIITHISQANPAVVTSADHDLVTGNIIFIYGVQGMVGLNGASYTVTVIDPDNFSLDGINGSLYGIYTGDGIYTRQPISDSVFWTRLMSTQTGVFHQMSLVAQGKNESFRLHALICHFKPTGRIYRG